ncbi:hypothetical protein ACFQAT_01365 [Undibacterium arcticum]|uniref:Uncharacterized protein n=1 Tax=Undibacterium arcticum TaxID=1762892 RepID=A0ABV7F172_9BURK
MDRVLALKSLIDLRVALPIALAHLSEFEWECDETLAELKSTHIAGVLNRFLAGELNSPEVESWANAIECREDIRVPDALTREAVHELANPTLTTALTSLRAQWWLSRLRALGI